MEYVSNLFLLTAKEYPIVYIDYIFVHSSIYGHRSLLFDALCKHCKAPGLRGIILLLVAHMSVSLL